MYVHANTRFFLLYLTLLLPSIQTIHEKTAYSSFRTAAFTNLLFTHRIRPRHPCRNGSFRRFTTRLEKGACRLPPGRLAQLPENSLAAIESVIGMGADIVEIDLALTSDSVLVVCHDRTLNRTTTGKGLIAEIPYDSIQRCFLKSGHGVATSHRMPTLREALELCKDRIVVNIDKGYQYYDLVQRLSEELWVTGQLSSRQKPVADVAAKFSATSTT